MACVEFLWILPYAASQVSLFIVLFYQCYNDVLDVHMNFCRTGCFKRGTRRYSWLRHCAKRQKVAGSISDDEIAIFHSHNPSGRNTAVGSSKPLAEMSTRNISWGVKAAGT